MKTREIFSFLPLVNSSVTIGLTICYRWMFIYKSYILIKLTFLKELIFIRKVHQKSVISFCNGGHDVLTLKIFLREDETLLFRDFKY